MRPSRFTATLIGLASALSMVAPALAQMPGGMNHEGHQGMPGMMDMPGMSAPAGSAPAHAGHAHDVGPAGSTYDLRFIDGMVQHHTGALRMSEFVFGIGSPGVGALGKTIWRWLASSTEAIEGPITWPLAPLQPGETVDVKLRPRGAPGGDFAVIQLVGAAALEMNRADALLQGLGADSALWQQAIEQQLDQGHMALAWELLFERHSLISPSLDELRRMVYQRGCGPWVRAFFSQVGHASWNLGSLWDQPDPGPCGRRSHCHPSGLAQLIGEL